MAFSVRLMKYIDVFNGDADGICALHQLRLFEPRDAVLVTGVKRDIALLKRVDARADDRVVVLDVSLDKNREALLKLVAAGVHVRYFDHHFAGELPESDYFEAHIDTSADVCTSLLVNQVLAGRYLPWAVVAAFGDNLFEAAADAAAPLALSSEKLAQLQLLGTLMNYNGYGVTLDDLHVAPDQLYRAIQPYDDPFHFIAEAELFTKLKAGYEADMAEAASLTDQLCEAGVSLFMLPDAPWSRRVAGAFGNALARQAPDKAHALLTVLPDGGFRVSVRAPLHRKSGADRLCMQFPSGGGRKAAAGVNVLPEALVDTFIAAFKAQYGG